MGVELYIYHCGLEAGHLLPCMSMNDNTIIPNSATFGSWPSVSLYGCGARLAKREIHLAAYTRMLRERSALQGSRCLTYFYRLRTRSAHGTESQRRMIPCCHCHDAPLNACGSGGISGKAQVDVHNSLDPLPGSPLHALLLLATERLYTFVL